MEGRWVLVIQKVSYLCGYFSSWQIAGILCLLTMSVLLLLGSYALFIYLFELCRARQAQAATVQSFRDRQDAMTPIVATFKTVRCGPAKGEYSEEEQCPVCRDDYEAGQELSCPPCGHAFHSQCLVDHMATPENPRQKPPTCPLCRAELMSRRPVIHFGSTPAFSSVLYKAATPPRVSSPTGLTTVNCVSPFSWIDQLFLYFCACVIVGA